jgi:HK97 family phage major capsid protein
MNRTDFEEELYHFLIEMAYTHADDRTRASSHWEMNLDWYQDITSMRNARGTVMWEQPVDPENPGILFGMRIVITEDGSIPHLEDGKLHGQATGHHPAEREDLPAQEGTRNTPGRPGA